MSQPETAGRAAPADAAAPGGRAYLETLHRLRVHAEPPAPKPTGWRSATIEELLLTHGRAWTVAPLPRGIRYGPPRQCFRNALLLAERRPALTYVEGYAAGPLPVHHAWCVIPDGRVVDPTWRRRADERAREYFGVPFKTRYVLRVLRHEGAYGVLYAWRADFPVMTADPAEFLAALPAPPAS